MIPKSIHNNRFVSPIIYDYMVDNDSKLDNQKVNLGKHSITILNGSISDLALAQTIFQEVQGLAKSQSNDTIHTSIYLIDFPKLLDLSKSNITSAECNSASTTFYIAEEYVEVVLWRSEEWTKVLYHELIHAILIDYTLRIDRVSGERLKDLLVHYNNSIREAYTEVLATLLETTRTNSSIKDQCIFLGTQVNKIAFYMECKREELVDFERNTIADLDDKSCIECISNFFTGPKAVLDQSTNTSSYYILKSIYLWCGVYKDTDLLSIKNMIDKGFINKKFYSVILEALESGEYVKWLKSIYFKPVDKSLRLTLPW